MSEDGARPFLMPSNRIRDSGQKVMHRRFQGHIRKNFTVQVTEERWNRLPRGAVESLSLKTF